MASVSIDEILRDLPRYLAQVREGETVVIVQDEKPVAELRPVAEAPPKEKGRRPFGLERGRLHVPDDFDDPLPEDILREFEGG